MLSAEPEGVERRKHAMQKILHGKIHGKTIELEEDPGLAENQVVEITLKTATPAPSLEGLQRCAGALADEWTEEDDQVFEMLRQERKRNTRKLPE
jgi:hypothetical protein